jgi:hypothetical protein
LWTFALEHPSRRDLTDQHCGWRPVQAAAGGAADGELDEQVGLDGDGEGDLVTVLELGFHLEFRLETRSVSRSSGDCLQRYAQIHRSWPALGNRRSAQRQRQPLSAGERPLDDGEQIDVAPARDVVSGGDRPVQDDAHERGAEVVDKFRGERNGESSRLVKRRRPPHRVLDVGGSESRAASAGLRAVCFDRSRSSPPVARRRPPILAHEVATLPASAGRCPSSRKKTRGRPWAWPLAGDRESLVVYWTIL